MEEKWLEIISKKNIVIAGSLPAQNDTYIKDERDTKIIENGFLDQALCLKDYVDFYYYLYMVVPKLWTLCM
mgnify:CR=1 FL=1